MNTRFSDYTTSGAFTLGLTRNQVAALAMLQDGTPLYMAHSAAAALERKGLAEAVPNPTADQPEGMEFRATFAGLLTANLAREAGLTNGPPDPVAAELATMRRELVERRQQATEAVLLARAAIARKEAVELELANEQAKHSGGKLHVRILPRDPMPETTDAQLRQRLEVLEP